jgi:hypothetical protein
MEARRERCPCACGRLTKVSRILRLALLAPAMDEAILAGRTDRSLKLEQLERPLLATWEEQGPCFQLQGIVLHHAPALAATSLAQPLRGCGEDQLALGYVHGDRCRSTAISRRCRGCLMARPPPPEMVGYVRNILGALFIAEGHQPLGGP